ncbi:MAG: hypothetical protein ABI835_01395 [Chloroflexota bacterium]
MSEETLQVPAPPRSRVRRVGCIAALVVWFAVLLLPCFLIVLAVQQEIVISTGSAPGQQTRLWLISEADERGLAYSSTSTQQSGENALCVQTDVRFFLWTGSAEATSYCECYQRSATGDPWSFTESISGVCPE